MLGNCTFSNRLPCKDENPKNITEAYLSEQPVAGKQRSNQTLSQ
jgi:hypothetical protein